MKIARLPDSTVIRLPDTTSDEAMDAIARSVLRDKALAERHKEAIQSQREIHREAMASATKLNAERAEVVEALGERIETAITAIADALVERDKRLVGALDAIAEVVSENAAALNDVMATMKEVVKACGSASGAVDGLVEFVRAASARQEKSTDALCAAIMAPKRLVRKDGIITGLETDA